MSKIETLLEALLNDENVSDEAKSRNEVYLHALLNGVTDVPEPKSRTEALLYALSQKGMSGGGSSGGDNPLKYATFNNGTQPFRGSVFPENYHLKIHIKGTPTRGDFGNWFSYSNAKEYTIEIDEYPTTGFSIYGAFSGCNKATDIYIKNNPAIIQGLSMAFQDCIMLENIHGVLNPSNITAHYNNAFSKCYVLKEVRFAEKSIKLNLSVVDCKKLSNDSIQSIIDGLADLTGVTAQTLTLYATVKAKLTDEQIATITSKNWTLA